MSTLVIYLANHQADILGRLRRMDALVHICYEVSGTAGAFCTALGLIPFFGNNMSFIITRKKNPASSTPVSLIHISCLYLD